jgi:hypothetical protein
VVDPDVISDSTRKWKLFESEKMEDRMPSQFYRHLKKLTPSSVPNDFILTLWKIRLPVEMQQILVVTTETDANALTKIADRIHEIQTEAGRSVAASEPRNCDYDGIRGKINQLKAQVSEVSIDSRRPPNRRWQC